MTFQWDLLGEKLVSQYITFQSLIIDIFRVPLDIMWQVILALENVLWLWWIVFAWGVRIIWIVADFLYIDVWQSFLTLLRESVQAVWQYLFPPEDGGEGGGGGGDP